LIKYATKGGKYLTKTIYGGASLENPFEVSGFFTGAGRESLSPALSEVLTEIASWKIRLAYFPVKGIKLMLDFELDIELRSY
jgi:hypothetical protein